MKTETTGKSIKLLIVEDDQSFAYIVRFGLQRIGGYEVLVAGNGKEGYEMWCEHQPDIIMADVEMPVMNGYEMVAKIRETDPYIPIMFTSSYAEPHDVMKGYEFGASNYVKKPCVPEELDCHLRALIKLSAQQPIRNEERVMVVGKYTYDPKHLILKAEDGTGDIKLTNYENTILEVLCKNKGEIVKREVIMDMIWHDDGFYASRRLDTQLNKLREKVEKGDSSIRIITVRSVGLRLTDDVKEGK